MAGDTGSFTRAPAYRAEIPAEPRAPCPNCGAHMARVTVSTAWYLCHVCNCSVPCSTYKEPQCTPAQS